MAFSLELPDLWRKQGWKVKIRDDERMEPPHATVIHKTRAWRLDLREGTFLDREPPPRDLPAELLAVMWSARGTLCRTWDEMYPENPVFSREDDR